MKTSIFKNQDALAGLLFMGLGALSFAIAAGYMKYGKRGAPA